MCCSIGKMDKATSLHATKTEGERNIPCLTYVLVSDIVPEAPIVDQLDKWHRESSDVCEAQQKNDHLVEKGGSCNSSCSTGQFDEPE